MTLGTLAMFRGVGYIILGTASVNQFPEAFTDFGIYNVGDTPVPWTIVPFLVLAPIFAIVLQKTATGRRIYAIGGNPDTARLFRACACAASDSGCSSSRASSAPIAGIVFTARLSNARANNALGFELDIITIALLGGVSVFGGRGRLTGVLWALALVATIRNVLGLSQIGGDAQGMVIGLLLIVSLLASNSATQAVRASAHRPPAPSLRRSNLGWSPQRTSPSPE